MTTLCAGKTSAPTVDHRPGRGLRERGKHAPGLRPAWWLPGPHAQTIWAALYRAPASVPLRPERLEMSDGDFIDLGWTPEPGPGLVVVLHGLEGIGTLGLRPRDPGRGAAPRLAGGRHALPRLSGIPNRLPRSYHSGETGDLRFLSRPCAPATRTCRCARIGTRWAAMCS